MFLIQIQRSVNRVRERAVELWGATAPLARRIASRAGDLARRLEPWLRQVPIRTREAWREHGPVLRERLIAARDSVAAGLRPAALRRRAEAARKWAAEHDTVPQEATARRRELLMERLHRHDQREAERRVRQEEQVKKREKKDLEERQTYSVYFE